MSWSLNRERARAARDRGSRLALWPLLAHAVLAGCADGSTPTADAVARLGDQELPYSRFERYLESNLDTAEESAPVLEDAVASRLFDQFLDELLLVNLAAERGYGDAGESIDQRSAVDHLLHGVIDQSIDPASIAAYYDAHRARWEQPAQVRLWQILVPERSMIDDVVRALEGGESFRAAARRLVADPDAGFCGEQGPLAREDLPAPFADAIFALDQGEVSEVLATDYGFYLFMVEEHLPARVPSLGEVEGEIRDTLLRERMDARMAELLAEAQARYDVRVFASNLPFDYRGSYAEQKNDA